MCVFHMWIYVCDCRLFSEVRDVVPLKLQVVALLEMGAGTLTTVFWKNFFVFVFLFSRRGFSVYQP